MKKIISSSWLWLKNHKGFVFGFSLGFFLAISHTSLLHIADEKKHEIEIKNATELIEVQKVVINRLQEDSSVMTRRIVDQEVYIGKVQQVLKELSKAYDEAVKRLRYYESI